MFSRQRYSSFVTPTPLPAGDCLVIGFLGGLEAWDARDQGVRKVALALRARNLSGLHVETVEEKKRKLARQLAAIDVPILLTVQVDSVGATDHIIPANVAMAANIYQTDGLFVRGERTIRAQDPSKTAILGNFRFAYQDRHIDLSAVPWYKLACRVAHSKMNADPQVWALVEELIVSAAVPSLPAREPSAIAGGFSLSASL